MSTKSRLELIKEAARKYKEEQEFQQAVATVLVIRGNKRLYSRVILL